MGDAVLELKPLSPIRVRPLNIVLIVSGSIACYKACELVSRLRKEGHAVKVIATPAALRFVGRVSFEGLSGNPVLDSLWARRDSMAHISLREWADLYLFYPATANRLCSMAAGLADDLAGAAFLANSFRKPFWLAPAANEGMMAHPAVLRALDTLQSWGCRILHGEPGRLACGDTGAGRLMEPILAAGEVRALARAKARKARSAAATLGRPPRVLVTGGRMDAPLDTVRSIVNTSSGRTAAALAAEFLDRGWEVLYLAHASADTDRCEGASIQRYSGYGDLDVALAAALTAKPWDAVVHAAAVSDYLPEVGLNGLGKLDSGRPLSIGLRPTAKLLATIKTRAAAASHPKPFVVGFKLTSGADEGEQVAKVASCLAAGVDRVLWNELPDVRGQRPFTLYTTQPGSLEASEDGLKPVPLPLKSGRNPAALTEALVACCEAAL